MSRAMGSFEHNWTLDCVCDGGGKRAAQSTAVRRGATALLATTAKSHAAAITRVAAIV